MPPSPSTAFASCVVAFGAGASAAPSAPATLGVGLPVLAGSDRERLLEDTGGPVKGDGFLLFPSDRRLAGFAAADAGADLEAATSELYRQLFRATAGLHLYRIWNYVPRIHGSVRGMEGYHRFCRGRSLAFEREFGAGFQRLLPAASAVGTPGGPLQVAFLAGRDSPRHFENPQQVPAFAYPPAYGPRPPSFSRATLVAAESGRQLFVSGTAAIRGHATVAADDLEAQLACTFENLRLVAAVAGAGPDVGKRGWRRRFKVYLRRPADLGTVQAALDRSLADGADTFSFLQAEICRSDLLVEIEAVLTEGG